MLLDLFGISVCIGLVCLPYSVCISLLFVEFLTVEIASTTIRKESKDILGKLVDWEILWTLFVFSRDDGLNHIFD